MNTEKLYISHFAGITEAEIELSRINIFIGPQASGKSICVKLFFFFKEAIDNIARSVLDQETKATIRSNNKNDFMKYFPPSGWGSGTFSVRYSCGDLWIRVTRTSSESSAVGISYSALYDSILIRSRHTLKQISASTGNTRHGSYSGHEGITRQFSKEYYEIIKGVSPTLLNFNSFIPAGRSFFSILQRSVWRLLAKDEDIDPFLTLFGSSYERTRDTYMKALDGGLQRDPRIEQYVSKLICGNYLRIRAEDFIQATDGRKIPLETSSSGQQEALPLALTLAAMAYTNHSYFNTAIIEEPEAHLYPSSQRDIVHLLAMVAGVSSSERPGFDSQFLITTHSPYILSALNNLMYAGKIVSEAPDKKDCVSSVLDDAALVDPSGVRAYFLNNGTVQSIIDKDTGLVEAAMLDGVSNELAAEFDALVDVAYGDEGV